MVAARGAVLALIGASCGPRAEPATPEAAAAGRVPKGSPPPVHEAPPRQEAAGPRYLVGEVCINAELRGAHYFPLFAGGDIRWTAEESIAQAPLTEAPQHFTVLGFDGKRHGRMVTTTDGATTDPRGFVGEYRGVMSAGPCSLVRPDGMRVVMWDCGQAGGCGIAVAEAALTSPPPAPPVADRKVAELCVAEGALIGDFDGDGAAEAYPIDGFRDQASIQGVPYTGAPCKGRFAWYRVAIAADILDVLGAADLDQDGHLELMTAFTPARGQRSVALYTPAPAPARRLDRRAVVLR